MARRRTRANTDYGEVIDQPNTAGTPMCWLCQRALGDRIEWHHPIPKSRGGRQVVPVHPICHRALHTNFTNAELARIGNDLEVLRVNGAVAKFLAWVAGKDPNFHAPTAKKGNR